MTRRFLAVALLAGLALATPAAAIIIIGGKSVHLVPFAAGQVVRVHVANLSDPPEPNAPACEVVVSWFRPDGRPAGDPTRVSVAPGTVEVADFSERTPFGAHRALRIEAVLTDPPDPGVPCLVQFEVFDRLTGRTQHLGAPELLPAVQR